MDFSPPSKMGFKMGFGAAAMGFEAASQGFAGDTLPPTLAGQLGHPGMLADPRLLDPAAPVAADGLEPPPTPIITDPTKHTTIALALQQQQQQQRQHPTSRSQAAGSHAPCFTSTGSQLLGSQGGSRARRLKLALKIPSETYSCPHAVIYFDQGGQLRGVASEGFLRCTDRLPPATRQSLTEALRTRLSRQSLANGHTGAGSESRRRASIAETAASATEEEEFATYPEELAPGRAGFGRRLGSHHHKRSATTQSTDTEDQDMDDSGSDEHPAAGPEVHPSLEIRVGDEEAVKAFYQERFKLLQQIPCKSIAKDWIKAIEPKKQANHPYNGGKAAKVQKEKGQATADPERMVLLLHLLRKIWDPNAKNGYKTIDVDKLRQSTAKTVNAWGNQDKYEENGRLLNEIYRMRALEERWIRNEVDDTASFIVQQTVPTPSRERGKRKRELKGLSSEGPLLNFGGTDARSQQPGYAQSAGAYMPPPSENGGEYSQIGRRLPVGQDGAFGPVSHSPVSTMGSSEGQAAPHPAMSASPTHSTSFRRGSGHGSMNLYGSAGGAAQMSPYSSFTSDASHGDPTRPNQPLSPLRKRSVGTMNPEIAPRAGSSGSYQPPGTNIERQRRQQDDGYFQPSSTANQHMATSQGYQTLRPRARDAANVPYTAPRPANSQTQRHGNNGTTSLSFSSSGNADAPAVLENNPPWSYGSMAMQNPNTTMSDMNSWSASYSYDYNATMTSPTQTSHVNRMLHNVQLQPVPAGYPYSSQQEYSMTSPGWNGYGA